jgi:hypothetical protein
MTADFTLTPSRRLEFVRTHETSTASIALENRSTDIGLAWRVMATGQQFRVRRSCGYVAPSTSVKCQRALLTVDYLHASPAGAKGALQVLVLPLARDVMQRLQRASERPTKAVIAELWAQHGGGAHKQKIKCMLPGLESSESPERPLVSSASAPTLGREMPSRPSLPQGNLGRLLRQAAQQAREAAQRAQQQAQVEAHLESQLRAFKLREVCTGAAAAAATQEARYSVDIRTMVFGHAADAARGLVHYLCVPPDFRWPAEAESVDAIRAEFAAHGTPEDLLCVRYVLDEEAGSELTIFPNSPCKMDCTADGARRADRLTAEGHGKRLHDFVRHPDAQQAGLSLGHVAAIRIYSTAAFRSLNAPLRDPTRYERRDAHPFPVTVKLISEAASNLRAAAAHTPTGEDHLTLFRGLKNVSLGDEFWQRGGTELAPMSATHDPRVAVQYATGRHSVVMRINTRNFLDRGADISFLSCWPAEQESLYPPLTYLRRDLTSGTPGDGSTIEVAGASFRVVDVVPQR